MGSIIKIYIERWDFFRTLILEHIRLSFTAGVLAAVIGLLLGIAILNRKKLAAVVIGTVNVIYTIPSISMLGFLIPLTGIGNRTAVIALTVYGLLPVVRNTYIGITGIEKSTIEVAKGLGSTRWQLLYKIQLPLALPVILAGIRNMVVMIIALGGISSFIGAGGLGVAVYRGITTNNMTLTVAGSILIALIALTADFLIGRLEKRIRRKWRLGQ